VFASALASERCLTAASRSSESFCAALSADAALRDCLRSALRRNRRSGVAMRIVAVLWSRAIIAGVGGRAAVDQRPKLSFPGDGSERAASRRRA